MSTNALHTKYRPAVLADVIGQPQTIKSLATALEHQRGHSFLFTGPAGTGKTTLGRIIATMVGCDPANLMEVDAATHTGVDAMREVTEGMRYMAIGKSPVRVGIVDECHMLSKSAWNSMLKAIEEPPDYVYWVLCTTEPSKVPATIATRCLRYELKPIRAETVFDYLKNVAAIEKMATDDDVLYLISERCGGSLRWALTALAQCDGVTKRKEAAKLLRQIEVDEGGDVIKVCRALMQGVQWPALMELAKPLSDVAAESSRIVIVSYFSKVLMGADTNEKAQRAAAVLDNFKEPYPQGATFAHLLLSLAGTVLA